MSGPSPAQPQPPDPRDSAAEPPSTPSASADDIAALQRVLEESLAATSSDELLEAVEIDALREVAQRHREDAFNCDAVAVELVGALLKAYFDTAGRRGDLWQSVAGPVADALCRHPESRARLERLWARLRAGAAGGEGGR